MQILLGCGHKRDKRIGFSAEWTDLVTLDMNEEVKPDVVWDMDKIPLPFGDNSAEEIHAYEVLEHTGRQGDFLFFFRQFEDFWRILKPDGLLFASVPMWNAIWALSDPGHTRIISRGSITFLQQKSYSDDEGKTARTDYRNIYRGDFKYVYERIENETYHFGLQAIK